jgi:hypothetical protein
MIINHALFYYSDDAGLQQTLGNLKLLLTSAKPYDHRKSYLL